MFTVFACSLLIPAIFDCIAPLDATNASIRLGYIRQDSDMAEVHNRLGLGRLQFVMFSGSSFGGRTVYHLPPRHELVVHHDYDELNVRRFVSAVVIPRSQERYPLERPMHIVWADLRRAQYLEPGARFHALLAAPPVDLPWRKNRSD